VRTPWRESGGSSRRTQIYWWVLIHCREVRQRPNSSSPSYVVLCKQGLAQEKTENHPTKQTRCRSRSPALLPWIGAPGTHKTRRCEPGEVRARGWPNERSSTLRRGSARARPCTFGRARSGVLLFYEPAPGRRGGRPKTPPERRRRAAFGRLSLKRQMRSGRSNLAPTQRRRVTGPAFDSLRVISSHLSTPTEKADGFRRRGGGAQRA